MLGEALFQLSWLAPPNLALLAPGAPHYDCNAQWQDLRADLMTFGTSLRDDAPLDAGSAPVDASIREGGMADARAASSADGANGGPTSAAAEAGRGDAGCAALPWNGARHAGYAAALGLVLLLVLLRGGAPSPLRARDRAVRAARRGCGAARVGRKAPRPR
jgi:hypothetical protein